MRSIFFLLIIIIQHQFFAQTIVFSDNNLKNTLISTNCVDIDGDNFGDVSADTNNNGEIEVLEAENVTGLFIPARGISSLDGLEYFINLTFLGCHNNRQISNIDLSYYPNLEKLNCSGNNLSELNLNSNLQLTELFCQDNDLILLDVSNNTSLQTLFCGENSISNIQLGSNPNLEQLNCNSNQLNNLDLTTVENLRYLNIENNNFNYIDLNFLSELYTFYCNDNNFESFDFENNTNLSLLECNNNNLIELDLSNLENFNVLYCSNNPLTTIDISDNASVGTFQCNDNPNLTNVILKNGGSLNMNTFELSNNPNLHYICVDDFELEEISNKINELNYTNVAINTYCSFENGGTNYLTQGEINFDLNQDGCSTEDPNFPFVKLNYNTSNANGVLYINSLGNYNLYANQPAVSITPELLNFNNYTISPSDTYLEFVDESTPITQNFCVESNNILNDLEVFLIPLNQAIPGFETNYKLVYLNKGNTPLSGTIQLNYQNEVMNLVESLPRENDNQNGIVNWSFSNILPLEQNEIELTFLLNTPTDSTPLNGGETLSFTSNIDFNAVDETPNDNEFILNQPVVNSFDPNDKTCLEGNQISIDKVGEYVHYLIRFENIGTANATNIVVKDTIDTTKLDVNSLIPLQASHSYFVSIKNENQVEFIFENIQLPFDDENNDGFILFKIKTLPSLIEGDIFNNHAEIYFDFNLPIITNTVNTEIVSLLNVGQHHISNIKLYPNPIKNVLYINSDYNINQVDIFDVLGKRVLYKQIINSNQAFITTKQLDKGVYFVQVKSNNQLYKKKIIKK